MITFADLYSSVMDRIYNLLTEEKFSDAKLLLAAFKDAFPDNSFLQDTTKESQRSVINISHCQQLVKLILFCLFAIPYNASLQSFFLFFK